MDSDAAVVIDKAELAKAVHKKADAGPCCSDHLRKGLLRYLWNHRLGLAGPAEFCHQEENACQPLFAGVEELIHKISLSPHTARQQEFQEQVREVMLFMHHADHLFSLYLECCAGSDGDGCGQPQSGRRGQRLFSYKVSGGKESDGGFLAGWRNETDK